MYLWPVENYSRAFSVTSAGFRHKALERGGEYFRAAGTLSVSFFGRLFARYFAIYYWLNCELYTRPGWKYGQLRRSFASIESGVWCTIF